MFGSIATGRVTSELCYTLTILQRNNPEMTILWSFSCNPFVKFHGKMFLEPQHDSVKLISML